ncbi:3-oxoacyl-(Acyl-carrier-protein) reductase, involved in Hassallidin biosynthesis [Planktothrix serta PCC 8927]|uniref:3-oxoacyl-(Acyl-carrier-protein) reductase, involved in Hassallidin biosynthesis n=1 Tax=Planktothrix serta PCC 8927 TaxID=671068 RepID=A0A1J1JPJ6_9CYAN|nr:SDR family oxidoreductase [Planktothrix serta]CZT62787.1 3-oxoacyl-(Acyl-carrier-protein) reductase, involved in Hassallidin biosynthesis [Planktothrix serta PCC 8927]VXD10555.1 3-oxoacyl-(Acyl-carrier-protein) reductase, involved in Hassallidin biosynthesis [Planktothrix serta PCC 8927]
MKLEDIRAIVTGSASGIGRCITLELARAGAKVVGGDLDVDGLKALEAESAEFSGKVYGIYLDVANEVSVKDFIIQAFEKIQDINTLVNNAGILRDGLLVTQDEEGWLRKLPTAQWKRVIDVNLTGAFLMAREFAATVIEKNITPSLIVNISSITRSGNPGQSNYSASKAGLDADTRTWALELAPFGFRVAGIAPGLTNTPILSRVSTEALAEMTKQIPLGRIAEPYEIWQAMRFIIECDYFTGSIIDVDGGVRF